MFPYNIGCGAGIGAGLPPNPVTTAGEPPADAPNPELPPKPPGAGAPNPAGAGEPKPPEFPKPPAAGAPNPVEPPGCVLNPPLFIPPTLTVFCAPGGTYVVPNPAPPNPPLLAPFNFSCVRPCAAIPSTAPIAIWNNPAPCSVNGCHCELTAP